VLTAVVAGIYASTPIGWVATGGAAADGLAAGLSHASIALAVFSALGIVLSVRVARRPPSPHAVDYAAAAASTTHTLPVAARE
jgi:hypothetical protein